MARKSQIAVHLEANDVAAAAKAVVADHKSLNVLIRLSYAKDTLVGWRAISAVGMAARELIRTDQAFLRETCRKLLWSLSDESGGIGWSAPELLGEIVGADPRTFADLIPLIANVYDIEEKVFRPGVVFALLRIAESEPALVLEHQKVVIASLVDSDPLVRFHGLELVGRLWEVATGSGRWTFQEQTMVRTAVEHLASDREEVWIYRGEGFSSEVIGEMAEEILDKIK